jgi:hypothetical protein
MLKAMVRTTNTLVINANTSVNDTKTRMNDEHHSPYVGDQSHSCKENGVGRVDRGLQGFSHGIFDRRAELCRLCYEQPLTGRKGRNRENRLMQEPIPYAKFIH